MSSTSPKENPIATPPQESHHQEHQQQSGAGSRPSSNGSGGNSGAPRNTDDIVIDSTSTANNNSVAANNAAAAADDNNNGSAFNSANNNSNHHADESYSNKSHEPVTPKTPKTPAVVWSAKESQYEQGYNEDVTISEGTTMGQFFVTVKKNIILKLRDPCNLILEICIPLIFVLGIVGLWAAIPNDNFDGKNLFDNSKPVMQSFFNESDICMNMTANSEFPAPGPGAPATRFMPCNLSAPGSQFTTFCFPQTDLRICTSNVSKLAGSDLFGYLGNFEQGRAVPDVDQMIVLMLAGNQFMPDNLRESYLTVWTGVTRFGKIHLAGGDETLRQAFRWYLGNTSILWPYVAGRDFATGDAANDFTSATEQEGDVWGIIEFLSLTDNNFNTALHFNKSGAPWTNRIVDRFVSGGLGERTYRLYFTSGWMTWQRAVNEFYYSYTSRAAPPSPVSAPMPYINYTNSAFLSSAGILIPLLIVFSFLYPVSQQTKRLVEEKEKRIREAMLIMGLGSGSFYLSHWLTYQLVYLVTSLLVSILLKLTVFNKSDFFIIFFLFYFFCLSCISLCSLLSSWFSKSRLAALLSPVLFFIIAIPFFAVSDASVGVLTFFSLLSPSAFAIGVNLIASYETGTGMGSSDFASAQDDLNMAAVYFFLIFDAIWYFLLALYFDNILPSEWGTQEHCCFCYIRCFSACRSTKAAEGAENDGRDPNGQFEPEPNGKPSVQLMGLRKEFTRGAEKFVAVNDLTLNLYEGQISVILGHNGAGKTTAINLMTGMLAPDAGDCLVYGKSVLTNMRGVRQEIGFCPQHNILWEEMTCREHLEYFAKLKGLTGQEQDDAVLEMIRAVDLEAKIDEVAGSLSGGMKRKLSVAIAFVGRSRVVFLDEPTAGMDVAARRHTWDLIKRMSPGRTIVLTTHYMDEADLLGNSISIMSKGKLKCKGSSLFLKSRLGVGYTLNCNIVAAANIDGITEAITASVPDADISGHSSGEISFRLPMGNVPQFPDMLAALESQMQAFGIKSFGLSATTIEEVFLKIGHDEELEDAAAGGEKKEPTEEEKKKKAEEEAAAAAVDMDAWHTHRSQPSGFGRQFTTLFAKRFAYAKRDTRTQVFQVWLPIVCLIFAMLTTLVQMPPSPPLEIIPAMYEVDVEVAFADCSSNFTAANARTNLFTSPVVKIEDKLTTNSTAFSLALQDSYLTHDNLRMTGLFCANSNGGNTPVLLHNSTGRHALPEGIQQYYRTHLKSTYGTDIQSTIWTAPLRESVREAAFFDSFSTLIVGIFILIPFTFIPSTFVSYVVKEREYKAKHAQLIAGMSPFAYWISNFCFDIICFLGTNFLAIIVFLIFQRDEYIGGGVEFGGIFLLFLFYAASGITGAYFCSFAFDNHASAQNVVMLANFIAGFLLVLAVWFFNFFPATEGVGKVLPFFCRIVPSYCLGEGIINMASRELFGAFGETPGVFDMDILGWNILYMAIEVPLFLGASLLLDSPARQRARAAGGPLGSDVQTEPEQIEDEDEDVATERKEVEGGQREDDAVIVRNLRKVYPSSKKGGKTAVRNMSFGVHQGEVFGFLGTNGAGKTSTMSILCGEQMPTHGSGSVAGFDVVNEASDARRVVGYCPQFDATLDLLNAEEHLYLYAGLRGIEPSVVPDVVNSLIIKAGLEPHRHTLSMNMSGGNRRKLSVAISLIGSPKVVILDEPSAGMDPMARRGLWSVIEMIASKCAIVLTTHHLEEVEALADRVAIMDQGALKCVGTLQQLKHKFGSGFEMSVRVDSASRCDPLRKFMTDTFPSAKEEEFRQQKFTYALPEDTKLSETFRCIEEAKERLGISDYSVSQTSLEQVFMRIGGADAGAE